MAANNILKTQIVTRKKFTAIFMKKLDHKMFKWFSEIKDDYIGTMNSQKPVTARTIHVDEDQEDSSKLLTSASKA